MTTDKQIEGLAETLAHQARTFIGRWYGSEGKATGDAVVRAIRATGRKTEETKLAAAATVIGEAAVEAFVRRRGERDRGMANELARLLELAAIADRR